MSALVNAWLEADEDADVEAIRAQFQVDLAAGDADGLCSCLDEALAEGEDELQLAALVEELEAHEGELPEEFRKYVRALCLHDDIYVERTDAFVRLVSRAVGGTLPARAQLFRGQHAKDWARTPWTTRAELAIRYARRFQSHAVVLCATVEPAAIVAVIPGVRHTHYPEIPLFDEYHVDVGRIRDRIVRVPLRGLPGYNARQWAFGRPVAPKLVQAILERVPR